MRLAVNLKQAKWFAVMTAIARATEIWSCTCHDIPYTAFPVPVTVTNAFDPIQSLLHSVMWPCACFTTIPGLALQITSSRQFSNRAIGWPYRKLKVSFEKTSLLLIMSCSSVLCFASLSRQIDVAHPHPSTVFEILCNIPQTFDCPVFLHLWNGLTTCSSWCERLGKQDFGD